MLFILRDDLKMATTVVSASKSPKKKFSAGGLFRLMTNSTDSDTCLVIFRGWNMFKKVAIDLFAPAAILLTRGSPLYISPIKSKLGFILSISMTWRDVIEISYK